MVELLEPSCTNPQKYICVPNSWISLLEMVKGVAIVQSPNGQLSKINNCGKRKELSHNWKVSLADIENGTGKLRLLLLVICSLWGLIRVECLVTLNG